MKKCKVDNFMRYTTESKPIQTSDKVKQAANANRLEQPTGRNANMFGKQSKR